MNPDNTTDLNVGAVYARPEETASAPNPPVARTDRFQSSIFAFALVAGEVVWLSVIGYIAYLLIR